MDQLVGYNGSIAVQFLLRGQPAVPTVASVFYTIFDHSGAAMVGYTDVAVTTNGTTTQISVALPSAILTIGGSKKFETRVLLVRYTINGLAYAIRRTFRVVPLLNHSVTPGMVRGYTGLNERELMDEDIDLLMAYLSVETDCTTAFLTTALSSGTETEMMANEAIMLKAVINLIPSLRQRVAQTETNGIVGFSRPKIIDFDKMFEGASSRYGELINTVAGRTESSPTLMVVTQPTDPVTGA